MYIAPGEMAQMEQEEERARLALAAAREQNILDEGEEDQPDGRPKPIQKLEADWKHARERLEHARRARGS